MGEWDRFKEDFDFVYNVILRDFLIVVWVYLVIWIVADIYL